MTNMLDTERPAFLSALPTIFQSEVRIDGTHEPLHTLLDLMHGAFDPIDHLLATLDSYIDPYEAPGSENETPGNKKNDFLTWLASWVGLQGLHEWPEAEWPEAKKRFVVSQAAMLYRHRGTLRGLDYMITLCLNLDVTIKEWEWPSGMVMGATSSIGLDTHLLDNPTRDRCFIVYWKTAQAVPMRQTVNALQALIEREKPAHTRHYILLDRPSEGTQPVLQKLIIGDTSLIGYFYLDREESYGTAT